MTTELHNSTFHLPPSPHNVMADGGRSVPTPNSDVNEKLLFLRENMVHLTNQLSMPIIEVALVISKYIRIVLESLENAAEVAGEELPAAILNPLPLNTEKENIELPGIESFPIEKLIDR